MVFLKLHVADCPERLIYLNLQTIIAIGENNNRPGSWILCTGGQADFFVTESVDEILSMKVD